MINKFCEEKIPSVKLIIHKEIEREDHYENFNSSLDISSIFNQIEYDGIFINMITGSDILLEDLIEISKRNKGIIFCDIHTLARGVNSKGERIFRQIPDAARWLSNLDIVQANENEIKTICNSVNEETTAGFVLQNGVKIFLVTKGRNGITCYFNLSGKKGKVSLEALKIESNNSVGCGDIFGAVFFYSYIYKMDLQKSLQKAVFAASETAKIKNIKELNRLKDVIYRKYFKEQDIDNRF
ncbi:MAG: carbohydrate kinase family protein [Ignavibacteria bacterium]|nr:carbohydrate kinase family protein [Ignavibacteria bacterium]